MAFNSNPGKQNFSATAAQTDFDFNFKIYDGETDIKVYLTPVGQEPDDTADILIFGTDYTVSIDGDAGGTVTLLSGATLNDVVVVLRDLPVTREISYVTQGDLQAATINIDQNYQTYLIIDGFVALAAAIKLSDTDIGISTLLPAVVSDAYLKWNAAGDAIENDTTIPDAVISAADSVLDANSWANEDEDVPVQVFTAGVGADRVPTVYSAKHYEAKSELQKWDAQAKALTSLSYAVETEDTPVNVVTSDGDGTFTYTPQAGVFSSLHYAAKAATFNPALYALLTGAVFTGAVSGITPTLAAHFTRKDYVDDEITNRMSGYKNLIINPEFKIQQYSVDIDTSPVAMVNATYQIDRTQDALSVVTGTMQRLTDQTVDGKVVNTIKCVATSTATGFIGIMQRLGNFYKGETKTFGAWVKSNSTLAVIQFFDGVSTTNSSAHTGGGGWEFLTVTKTIDASATLLYIRPYLTGAITSGDYIESTMWQLEDGSISTKYEQRDEGLELSLCNPFYTPITDGAETQAVVGSGHCPASTYGVVKIPTPNKMRTTPTLVGGFVTATDTFLFVNGSILTPSSLSNIVLHGNGVTIRANVTGATGNHPCSLRCSTVLALDAEIY